MEGYDDNQDFWIEIVNFLHNKHSVSHIMLGAQLGQVHQIEWDLARIVDPLIKYGDDC